MERSDEGLVLQHTASRTDRLALYDQYGSVAYGIILQILPQPHLAQEVLVDLFASPELVGPSAQPSGVSLSIIRLARAKALAAKARHTAPTPVFSEGSVSTTAPSDLPKLIFDMSFCQGYTPDQIADRLQLSKADVLVAIHAYFKTLRQA